MVNYVQKDLPDQGFGIGDQWVRSIFDAQFLVPPLLPSFRCLTLRCVALRFVVVLRCVVLRCLALGFCVAFRCVTFCFGVALRCAALCFCVALRRVALCFRVVFCAIPT